LLEQHFIVRNIHEPANKPPLTLTTLFEYAHSIKTHVSIHDHVTNPLNSHSPHPPAEKKVLCQLTRIATRSAGEAFNLLLLALYSVPTKAAAATRLKILQHIENISFISALGWWRIDDIPPFDARDYAIKLAARQIGAPDLLAALEQYVSRRNKKLDPAKLIGWWAQKPLGFYSWSAVAYFMFEYEQKLQEDARSGREKLQWSEFHKERRGHDYGSVEHILPQQVKDEYWKTRVRGYTVRQRNALKHTIGNLLPVSRPKNSSLSNKPFPEKRGTPANKVGYAYGCYSEIEVSQEADWTPQHIVRRSVRLLSFLEQRWGLLLGTDKDKIRMLGLDFVK
jgi:hypothetical protein